MLKPTSAIVAIGIILACLSSAHAKPVSGALVGGVSSVSAPSATSATLARTENMGNVASTKVCAIPARPPMTKHAYKCAMPNTALVGVVCYCPGVDKQDGVVKNGKPILLGK